MAKITFIWGATQRTVITDAGDRPTLLTVALAHGVPIPFNCTFGACGACLVRTRGTRGPGRGPRDPGEDEAWLLDAMGKGAPADAGLTGSPGPTERHRLACQCVLLGDEDIDVVFETSVGS